MKDIIGIVAASLAFIAYIPYFRDIRKSKSKPHVYSWFIWGFTSVLIFALQISHGAGAGSWTTATVAVISFIVCFMSLKNGTKYITTSDTIFFIMALVAAGLWLLAKQALLSSILLSLSDLLGIIPTIRKAWNKPNEETLSMWSLNTFRHGLAIVALNKYNIITMLNPSIWVVTNASFSIILITRRRVLEGKLRTRISNIK